MEVVLAQLKNKLGWGLAILFSSVQLKTNTQKPRKDILTLLVVGGNLVDAGR